MRRIVIAGCGFAGYHAARRLEKSLAGRRRVELTVVTRRAHFIFSRLLPKVATGELSPDHLSTPVDEALAPRTRVIVGAIEGIDLEKRQLLMARQPIPFDYLLIATGSRRSPQVFEGAEHLVGPDSLSDAVSIREDLQRVVSTDDRPLRFAIVGGSSSGVEWASELASALSEDHRLSARSDDICIDLFEAGPRLLPDHSTQLSDRAREVLEYLGVQIHTDTTVRAATNDELMIDGDAPRKYTRIFHCAGRSGLPLWSEGGLDTDDQDRLIVDPTLVTPSSPGIFVAGDTTAALPAVPHRSDPQLALQQGQRAARNLLAAMSGRTQKPFEFEARGDFLIFGRHHAALELRGILLEGRAAWLANRLYYTALMPRTLKKARLLVDWIARRIGSECTDAHTFPPRLSSD